MFRIKQKFVCALVLCLVAACSRPTNDSGNALVYDAWRSHRSNVEVTAFGNVAHVLGTRSGPSGMHEGFLVHLQGGSGGGLSVKVEDNVDISGPIPLNSGDEVSVHGEYVYNERGGIIHWTHHDPRGRHESGYIIVNGRHYE
ncbi:MAG TPA: DUF3465 domain-containing protein [Candidatus Baltobacteraceae bacterium]|jgi:hypothetical protein|nr:DUF3465 domain-containing protein [Candidatus Baltobacteraceae bacterium]